jgi:hypothetical protein
MQLAASLLTLETRSWAESDFLTFVPSQEISRTRVENPDSKIYPGIIARLDDIGQYPVHFSIGSRILKTQDLWVTIAKSPMLVHSVGRR